jgi:aspartyl-tRNA(Asn)/glutamyl-tRNA(Gln) amidotransferase subunit A
MNPTVRPIPSPDTTPLTTLTLTEAASLVAARHLSSVELTAAHLQRIETVDQGLNAFITVMSDDAMRDAHAADAAVARGDALGPLHGLPIALKDLFDLRGGRTTAGSKFFETRTAAADAAVVERLRAAGAVILGKLNMHEWALGVTNDNPHFGACANPWDLQRISGGSSGGCAAALAGEVCLGALGSDTGGSIRIPASLCGIVGLKPTFGRVSLREVIPLSWNLDHAGPMARRVRDAARLLQVIAGYDAADPYCANVPVDDYVRELDGGITGWQVGVVAASSLGDVESEVEVAIHAGVQVLKNLGASVHEVELPTLLEAARANGLMTTADAAVFHHERLERAPDDFGADVLARLRRGASYAQREYVQARRTQTVLRRQLQSLFRSSGGAYDVLVLPTTPIVAPLRSGLDAVATAATLTRLTAPFNLTGLPALSLPCGFTAAGLPIGVQIVGAPWEERRILRAGDAYEQATTWHQRQPPLAST